MSANNRKSPWGWIPTLYIAEGLPYFAVNTLTVLIYTQLGISKAEMAFYTGWLYLPWVIKPLWSPFIDIFSTKRSWALTMQFIITICMAAIAFLLPTSIFFASTLAIFWIMAFCSATHDIAADGYYLLALDEKRQAQFVGVRSTAYRIASVIGQGGLVMMAGQIEKSSGSVVTAWQWTFFSLSALFLLIFLWHTRFMPRSRADKPMPGVTAATIAYDFTRTFATFFRKPNILTAILFMLFYRLPEALCIKLVQPFLIDSPQKGGLGMNLTEVGFANGTIGVIALLGGGIVGGLLVGRDGLKRWLWPMALSLTLPCIVYCYMAMCQPSDFTLICLLIGIEQFGYGFGFTAFMMYLMYFSRGENSTSHYAFCTAFMALGMMLPGMAAGWIWERLGILEILGAGSPQGYINFFWLVMLSATATFAVTQSVYRTLKKTSFTD